MIQINEKAGAMAEIAGGATAEGEMLSYDDCVKLCGLTPEAVAAIARHEHLPEIVASGMGACLCRTPQGKRLIQRMIIEDSEEACRRGDTQAAARLGLVLHRFIEANLDRRDAGAPGSPALALAPAWVRERVDAYLGAVLRRFGTDRASAEEHFGPEMQIAKGCCASCTQAERCGHFLAGLAGTEASLDFCPNGPLLKELGTGLGLRVSSELPG